jgi:transposase InsO family protein
MILSTKGGNMPWQERNVMELRMQFIIESQLKMMSFSSLCHKYHISRQTGYTWLNRYHNSESLTALQELSRRPHHPAHQTTSELEGEVIAIRKERGEGAKKIQVFLAEKGIKLGLATINRIIARNHLVNPEASHYEAKTRFEREHPNELWQIDLKGLFKIGAQNCYPLTILDDYSRFVIGLYACHGPTTIDVQASLIKTWQQYGVPDAMLMDHGSPWWCTTSNTGLSVISIMMLEQGIELHHSRIRHPQTQGKVERFHRTLQQKLDHLGKPTTWEACQPLFDTIQIDYNCIRPHEALQMAVPADRYVPSIRPYNPHPPAWEYPANAWVEKLNNKGFLVYNREHYFVSKALKHKAIMLRQLGNTLLLTFRNMNIREINLVTGKTRPLLQPIEEEEIELSGMS